jgi:hypothetical protein
MSILFDGPVNVYLQGRNALLPIDLTTEQVTYWIGSEQTKLLLKDHRCLPINAAARIIEGENGFEFADIFNQPAIARVRLEDETVNIELHENTSDGEYPTLWLGVLDDNMMPNYKIEWEYLRPLDDHSTAISVLLKK